MELPESHLVPRVSEGKASAGSLDVMGELILSAVDGRSDIAAIADSCGVEDTLARRVVADLADRRIVEIPGYDLGESDEGRSSQIDLAPADDGGDPAARELVSEVDGFLEKLDRVNYYEILETTPDATRKELRSAYFALSKKLHPDRAFGKRAKELRGKMEVVFRRITQAYDILSSPKQREEYDAEIADQIEIWRIESQLEKAMRKDEPREDSAPSRSEPARPVVRSETPRAVRRSEPARPAVRSETPRAVRSSEPPEGARDERRRAWRRERVEKALQRTLLQGQGSQRISRPPPKRDIDERLAQAKIAMEQEQHDEAVRILCALSEEVPDSERCRRLLEEARSGASQSMAKALLSQGRHERRQGLVDMARASFERALKAAPDSIEARHELADLLCETRQDLTRALSYSKEVVGMGGQKARYFATLGEILILAKDSERAARAFEKALALEPDNRKYKKRLKACRS